MAIVPLIVWTIIHTDRGNEIRKNILASSPDNEWFNWRFYFLLHDFMNPKIIKKWQRENITFACGSSIEGEDFREGSGYDTQWFITWFEENGFDVDVVISGNTTTLNLFPQSDFS